MALVRDFSFLPTYTPKEDIERFLEMETKSGLNTQKRNQTRKSILQSFSTIDCCRFAPPSFNTAMCQRLENIKLKELSEDFQKDFEIFSNKLYRILDQNKIWGKLINGTSFVDYMKSICDIINQDDLLDVYEAREKDYN